MKVSVVITCYNYGRYVDECISSVLRQTYQNYEVIIVNDGSTDDSEDKIRPFLERENFRYVFQANSGQASAKNTGVRHSRGELVAFLDADDLWEPTKLERQVPLFDNPRVGVVYSRARFIDSEGRDIELDESEPCFETHSGCVTNQLFVDNFVPFSSSVVRARCLEECGIFDESLRMGIDWDLWLRISTKYDFAGINEPLLTYRVGHPGQMSRNMEVRQECSDRIMKRFIERFPTAVDQRYVRKAWEHTYLNRGLYYQFRNPAKSICFFSRALSCNPLSRKAYLGLARAVANAIAR